MSTQITITFPDDAESVLVRRYGDEYSEVPITHGMSALNLERDLQSHLNEYPFSDEWLAELRDFIEAKLAARQQAKKNGGIAIPLPKGHGFAVVTDFPFFRGTVEVTS